MDGLSAYFLLVISCVAVAAGKRNDAATLKNDKSAATKAYGQIQTKTPRLTAIVSSFKTKCR